MSLLFKNRQIGGAERARIGFFQQIIGWFVRHVQQGLGSLGEIWRTPLASLMTIGVLGVSLTLPSTLHVLVKNTDRVAQNWQTASEITLFLKNSASPKQVAELATKIGLLPQVASVDLIKKDEALVEFKEVSGFGEALDYLPDNPLPDVLLVQPSNNHKSARAAQDLLAMLEGEALVSDGKLDIEWLKRLEALVEVVEDVLGAVAALLCLAVVLIVGNTIRLAIMNRRDEIEVMKLVGATDRFIRRPFLYTGFWYGVFGGFIAWILVEALVMWLESSIQQMTRLYQSQYQLSGLSLTDAGVLFFIATVLGLLGSYIAVSKHIKEIEPG